MRGILSLSLALRKEPSIPQGRWMGRDNLHMTLRFLGEVPSPLLDSVKASCREASLRSSSCRIKLGGLGAFPRWNSAKVLVWKLQDDAGLKKIADNLSRQLEKSRIGFDKKPFKGHVTLARFSEPVNLSSLTGRFADIRAAIDVPEFAVDSFALIKSELTRSGAIYTELEKYCIGVNNSAI